MCQFIYLSMAQQFQREWPHAPTALPLSFINTSSHVDISFAHFKEVVRKIEHRPALPPKGDLLGSVTRKEVIEITKSLKPRSAPGPDNIVNFFRPTYLLSTLASIMNFSNCTLKYAWKEAIVIGITKPNKPKNPQLLGEVLRAHNCKRTQKYVYTNNLILPEQFGFQLTHSSPLQIYRLTEHILKGITSGHFFDVAKALDKF